MRRFDLHQSVAETKSARLVLLMSVMQVLTVLFSGVSVGYMAAIAAELAMWTNEFPFFTVMAWVGLATMLLVTVIIVSGAVLKFNDLKDGGKRVAQFLQAMPIDLDTSNAGKRRLLNVVEELAISSGLPVPNSYVLAGELGINAMAAGHTPEDAVIVVTEGALNRLSRDQLQGVIAHEFAHIANGDIAQNMWLLAFTHGNFCVSMMAQRLIEAEWSHPNGAVFAGRVLCHGLGYLLFPLGVIGAFFALVFTAQIKRQGEYLADATAVELTRLPDGLSDALLMIGGNVDKGRVRRSGAFEASHLFFADSGWSFAGWLDSHPPLDDRVIRLKPDWDGYYLFESEDELGQYSEAYREIRDLSGIASDAMGSGRRDKFAKAVAATVVSGAVAAQTSMSQTGSVEPAEKDCLTDQNDIVPRWMVASPEPSVEIDPVWRDLTGHPQGAGLVLAAIRLQQLPPDQAKEVIDQLNPVVQSGLEKAGPVIARLNDDQKMWLFDHALSTMVTAPATIRNMFIDFCRKASCDIESEPQLEDWAWQRITRLAIENAERPAARYGQMQQLLAEALIVVSAMIYTDAASEATGQYTFIRSIAHTDLTDTILLPQDAFELTDLDQALDTLGYLAARERRKLVIACAASTTANRDINVQEAWLLRAICQSLHFPMPSVLPGQALVAGA